MPQANKSSGSDFDTIEIQMEENQSLGSTAQGYPYRSTERYNPPQPARYYYQEPNDDWGCFLGETSVQLRDGRKVAMKDLKIGDRVRVIKPDGRLAYSPYIAMLHREPDKKTTFLQIYVEGKDGPVCLTPDHLIYATNNPRGGLGRPIFAKAVEEGMLVFLAVEESGKVAPAKVREVREMEATGFCAPLTKQGTIMADGVAASCYADFNHGICHRFLFPLRRLYGLKSALGIGGKEKEVVKKGVHWYPKSLMHVNKFLSWFHVQPATAG
ncbi:desert hedgehog protein B-like [Branchiostoma floridae x Branchiostoma belcheri]